MDKKLVVHFGAGALGRGLVVPLLVESGKQVVLAETNEQLLAQLQEQSGYTLHIRDDVEKDVFVKIQAACSTRTQKEVLLEWLQIASTVTTSVRRENLMYVAPILYEAWKGQSGVNRQVLCCENIEGVGAYFKELLLSYAKNDTEYRNLKEISVPDTIVDRICAADEHFEITTETFYECSVDQRVLKTTGIARINSTGNIKGHFYRKRYLLNSYADAISFLALAKGKTYLYEAAMDDAIQKEVLPYITLLKTLLYEVYGISRQEADEWFERYRKRLSNHRIPRELHSVARNLWVKLSVNERFVQPLLQLQERQVDIQEGVRFLHQLILSENAMREHPMSQARILSNLKELWGEHAGGIKLYEALKQTQEQAR